MRLPRAVFRPSVVGPTAQAELGGWWPESARIEVLVERHASQTAQAAAAQQVEHHRLGLVIGGVRHQYRRGFVLLRYAGQHLVARGASGLLHRPGGKSAAVRGY